MKAEELRSKSQDELQKFVLDQRKEQFNLRFQRANSQLENTGQLKTLRRDIARAKTIMAEMASGKAPATTAKKADEKKAAPKKETAKKTAAKKPAAKKTTAKKKA